MHNTPVYSDVLPGDGHCGALDVNKLPEREISG